MTNRIYQNDSVQVRNDSYNPIRDKTYKKRARKMRKKRSFYLFLTVVLIICLSQAIRGVYLNTSKYIILNQQLDKLGSLNNLAREKNLELRKQLKNYTSSKGIEALARDNLNMVGKDEVLVLIKESPKFPQKNKPAIKQAISN